MPVNTDELMNEVTVVLKNGLDKLLAQYEDKYALYEETHKCVVKLQGLLGNGPSPQSDSRYDKLEKQIEQMKEEIALLKMTGGKPICDLVNDDAPIAVKTEPVVKTESSVKPEPVVKTESSDSKPKDVQPSEEKENITLVIEPVQEQEESEPEGQEEEDEEEEEEKESEEEEEEAEEEEDEEAEEQESEGEELSDEEEEEEEEKPTAIAAPVTAPTPAPVTAPVTAPEEDEDEELFEIEIDDVSYCTNDEENGIIYALTADGDVGAKVGYLKDGEPFFE